METQKEKYQRIRGEWIKYLGGICSLCKAKDNLIIVNQNKDTGFSFRKEYARTKAISYIDDHVLLCNDCYKSVISKEAEERCQHGTHWKYKKWGCRCQPCTEAYFKSNMEATRKSRKKAVDSGQKELSKTNKCQSCGKPCLNLFCGRSCANKSNPERNAKISKGVTKSIIQNNFSRSGAVKCSFLFKETEISCDSILEYSCLLFYTTNFDVKNIERCKFSLPYTDSTGKNRNYIPDFIIMLPDKNIIVECKSSFFYHKDYNATIDVKKQTLIDYASKNNLSIVWFTDKSEDKFYKRNIRNINRLFGRKTQ